MSLLEFCRWLQYSAPLHTMRESPIFFPIVATIHLMGLALIGGAVLVVDLRLLGLALQNQPVAGLAHDAERWLFRGPGRNGDDWNSAVHVLRDEVLLPDVFLGEDGGPGRGDVFTWSGASTGRARERWGREPDSSQDGCAGVDVLWTTVAVGGRYIGFP
jgi:hypothetical protein